MNKTFKTIIDEQSESAVFNNIVDEATQQELIDYFYFRYVCDDEKFTHFFQRNLNQYVKQYNDYLRVQNITFDPMVTRYLERQILTTNTVSGSRTTSGTENGTKGITNGGTITTVVDNDGTLSGTDNNTTSNSYSNSSTVDEDGTNGNTRTSSNRVRDLLSVFPQANVSAATSGSLDDPVTYAYATQMTDHKDSSTITDAGTNTRDVSTSESGQGSGTNNTTINQTTTNDTTSTTTRNDTVDQTNNLTKSGSETTANEENSDVKERLTGRENYDTATLLSHARDYIRETNAFMFLVSKLEKCFIGNMRYGEEN